MTELVVTYKLREFFDEDISELTNEDINDHFREIAEKEGLELVNWGSL